MLQNQIQHQKQKETVKYINYQQIKQNYQNIIIIIIISILI